MDCALILSTIVSVVSILSGMIVAIVQQCGSQKQRSMELYFSAQLKAYTEFYQMAADLEVDLKRNEKRDIRKLISAAKAAEMLSPYDVANAIDNFCAVYIDYMNEIDVDGELSPETEKEFKDSLFLVSVLLGEELRRFDKSKRKYLKKLYKGSCHTIHDESD